MKYISLFAAILNLQLGYVESVIIPNQRLFAGYEKYRHHYPANNVLLVDKNKLINYNANSIDQIPQPSSELKENGQGFLDFDQELPLRKSTKIQFNDVKPMGKLTKRFYSTSTQSYSDTSEYVYKLRKHFKTENHRDSPMQIVFDATTIKSNNLINLSIPVAHKRINFKFGPDQSTSVSKRVTPRPMRMRVVESSAIAKAFGQPKIIALDPDLIPNRLKNKMMKKTFDKMSRNHQTYNLNDLGNMERYFWFRLAPIKTVTSTQNLVLSNVGHRKMTSNYDFKAPLSRGLERKYHVDKFGSKYYMFKIGTGTKVVGGKGNNYLSTRERKSNLAFDHNPTKNVSGHVYRMPNAPGKTRFNFNHHLNSLRRDDNNNIPSKKSELTMAQIIKMAFEPKLPEATVSNDINFDLAPQRVNQPVRRLGTFTFRGSPQFDLDEENIEAKSIKKNETINATTVFPETVKRQQSTNTYRVIYNSQQIRPIKNGKWEKVW